MVNICIFVKYMCVQNWTEKCHWFAKLHMGHFWDTMLILGAKS